MVHRCCSKQKIKRGLWSPEEDDKLLKYVTSHGHKRLQRCGKSCRLRWINYLRPDLKRGSFTDEEEQIIIDVHRILGNRQTLSSLPKAQRSTFQTPSTIISSQSQTPNIVPYELSDLPYEPLTENPTNICSSSYMDPSEIRLSNNGNNNIWVSSIDAEDLRVQSLEEGLQSQVQVEKDKTCEKGIEEIKEAEKDNLETNASLENSNFDFGLLESLLSSDFMSHDLNYMDELAWNF
ncbi:hypothetical protein TanjilG_12223 [Lupinus angustifolius]|uniref:HTH myb-type domain-containing protein n=1 Tax=Lupinus angustifolius TaxID=3871 RepID=A0A1J7HFX4_LUPAN|nr:hypothetical protein TanjilG_12223 [Lupinus angustifolius]